MPFAERNEKFMSLSTYPKLNNISTIHITPDGGWVNLSVKEEAWMNKKEDSFLDSTFRKISYFPSTPINKSARDFLLLCDGMTTYSEIIDKLSIMYSITRDEVLESINPFLEFNIKKDRIKLSSSPMKVVCETSGSKEIYYPVHMQFELTDKCNMYCNYCYRNAIFLEESKNLEKDLTERPFDEIKTALDNAYKNGVRIIEITGGEPMMSKHFLDIIELLSSYGVLVAVETNGTCITDEIADRIAEAGNVILSISLDAHNEELNYQICHLQGAFERTLNGLKLLKDRNVIFRVTSVACVENIDSLEEVLLLAMRSGAIEYGPALPISFGRQRDVQKKDKVQADIISNKFADVYTHLCDKYSGFITRVSAGLEEFHIEVGNCGAGHRSFSVDPDVNVRACPVNTADWSICGNIFTQSYESIFSSEKVEFFRKLPAPQPEYCLDCPLLPVCVHCYMRGVDGYIDRKNIGEPCYWAEKFQIDKIIAT